MTTTAVISGQAVGSGANVGNSILSQNQTTIQATTTAFVISAKLVNGTKFVDPGQRIRIWYSSTSWTVTAAQAVTQLAKTARYLDVTPSSAAGATIIHDSMLEPVTGTKINLWTDVPNFPTDGTLSVNIIELP